MRKITLEQRTTATYMLMNIGAGMIFILWITMLCNPILFSGNGLYTNGLLYCLMSVVLILSIKINIDVLKFGVIKGIQMNARHHTTESKQ